MPAEALYIDPSIRDWVLFPITLVMILVGILRHYVTLLLGSTPKPSTILAIRETRALLRAQTLRQTSAASPLPPSTYAAITGSLIEGFEKGVWLKDGPPKPGDEDKEKAPPNPLSDPGAMDGMMDMMKKQGIMMVPNFVIMGWINAFFSGFVLIKLPFPLTLGFKGMLQKDIAAPDMDVRWVSALSWYFLNLFGLNGVFRLILGDENSAIDASQQQGMIGAMPAVGGPAPDYSKFFKGEIENLQFAQGGYKYLGDGIEDIVLKKYGAKV